MASASDPLPYVVTTDDTVEAARVGRGHSLKPAAEIGILIREVEVLERVVPGYGIWGKSSENPHSRMQGFETAMSRE